MKTFSVERSRRFQVGQIVNATSFVGCFGETAMGHDGLTIVSITAIADRYTAHYRIDTRHGLMQIEGSELFFEAGLDDTM